MSIEQGPTNVNTPEEEQEPTVFNFGTLDPRNTPEAKVANEAILTSGPVYGIEVTIPALAEQCSLGNIDPQHTEGDVNRAAIEDALTVEIPPEGTTFVTVRADLDSIGSMVVLNLRAKGEEFSEEALDRINTIATTDKFARGEWAPKSIPTKENPWNEGISTAESSRDIAAIAAAVMDFKLPLAERVAILEKWVLTGEEPAQYREKVEKERLDLVDAIETGLIKTETRAEGKIAVVESGHRAATNIGYSLAPVVVALNPAFRLGGGEPHRKYTICQYSGTYVDLKAVFAELSALESGWGGSPNIGGSPQGVSSELSIDQVTDIVEKHLL
jgi:hypothetical protein